MEVLLWVELGVSGEEGVSVLPLFELYLCTFGLAIQLDGVRGLMYVLFSLSEREESASRWSFDGCRSCGTKSSDHFGWCLASAVLVEGAGGLR